MLDLTKLTRQMQGLSQHLTQEAAASRQRLELAQQHFLNACDRQEEFVQKQEKWRDRILFASATPVEPLNTSIEIPVPPKVHTVIATDGSQIAPNHHEIAYCYLLNIGRVVLHYGQNKHPLLDSLPEIFYRPEDLYISRQWGIKTEEWMSYCRTASEATVLAELACSVVSKDTETSPPPTAPNPHLPISPPPYHPITPSSKIPTLAMVDGSLIY
ncbi:nuclease, partial [Fischerella thermalis CCMEE 5273]